MSALSDLVRSAAFRELVHLQSGVVALAQLKELGLSKSEARRWIVAGRWRALRPGVYVTFTGPVPPRTEIWAAVLHGGAGAVASHGTALWLAGVVDELRRPLRVTVPHGRQLSSSAGVRVTRSRARHPGPTVGSPPRSTVEAAVLDLCDEGDEGQVVDLVLRAVQRRRTTPQRLREELGRRIRHRHRRLLAEVLLDSAEGIASVLERRYLHDVERAHGLPRGERNRPESRTDGRGNEYRDVRYREWQLLVELDGRIAHPEESPFRDMDRDNRSTIADDAVLRYGWQGIVGQACRAAAQVATMLQKRGWSGLPRRCGPNCDLSENIG